MDIPTIQSIYPAELRDQLLTVVNKTLHIRASWNAKQWLLLLLLLLLLLFLKKYGPGSSVGIATDYGLDGPGSNPGGDEIFRPSTPALVPTQPPVKCVLGLSRG